MSFPISFCFIYVGAVAIVDRTFIGEGVFSEGDEGVVRVRFVIIFWYWGSAS